MTPTDPKQICNKLASAVIVRAAEDVALLQKWGALKGEKTVSRHRLIVKRKEWFGEIADIRHYRAREVSQLVKFFDDRGPIKTFLKMADVAITPKRVREKVFKR